MQVAAEQPRQCQQIKQREHGHRTQAVFGNAGGAGAVGDGDFAHGPTGGYGEGRKKRIERANRQKRTRDLAAEEL
jgi:hypothetical protein